MDNLPNHSKIEQGNYFLFDEPLFHSLAFRWMRRRKRWKKYESAIIFLSFFAIILPLVTYSSLHNHSVDIAMSMAFGSLVFLAISGIIIFLFYKGQKQCGSPFLFMNQLYLCSDETGIQFYYHDTLDRKSGFHIIIQRIGYPAIVRAEIIEDLSMIMLYGKTECVRQPNMYSTNGKSEIKIKGKMSFFECFSNEQLFLQILQSRGVEIRHI